MIALLAGIDLVVDLREGVTKLAALYEARGATVLPLRGTAGGQ